MRSLWFKGSFVAPILSGEKTETIRDRPPRFVAGDVVGAGVGPRPPFAILEILSVGPIRASELTPAYRATLGALYRDLSSLTRVTFRVVG